MANQLAYCIIEGVSPLDSTSNSYIRVRFDITSGSNILTNVSDEGGVYSGINQVRPGQILRAGGSFSETTIISVNTASATITVSDGALTNETNELARISPGEGEYFIPSASLSDPQQLINYSNITGSEDAEYIAGTNRYGVLGKAYRNDVVVPGRFHLYEIVNVSDRNPSNSDAKLYVKWYESGSESQSGDTMSTQADQTTALLEISENNELVPIFKSRIVSGFNLDGGEEIAAYQIALESFFDSLSTGSTSTTDTGSLLVTASAAGSTITFTKGDSSTFDITVSQSGSIESSSYAASSSHAEFSDNSRNSVSSSYALTASYALNAGGGTGDGFPYSGDAVITGSLLVSGSGVSGSFSGSFEGDASGLTGFLWSNITNIPSGLVSSSSQIKQYNVFATTGSNIFSGDQIIDGLLTLITQSGTPTFVTGALYVDSNYDLYLGTN